MKPDADMISGAMAAEAALAKEETDDLEHAIGSLPEGHPLRAEVENQKRILGDLAGLPPGHPLLVAMEEARLRYEAAESETEDGADEAAAERERVKVRRAKKLDAKKARAEERRREDEEEERLRAATKRINSSMNETIDALRRLGDNIEASREDFAGDRYALMKLERLGRLVTAAVRGVGESRLKAGRAVSNG